ncbi:helix-turn-helix transcriptional regulator [Nonlabens tegetincola]|uniref:helix-turn-helix transcriptional regulator n=1 Tax=Nonlabens tegetincola TaxID=323273 RepID=UPI000CF52A8C|nr:WYL domain-containing protein [Nonlabens tegetincola]PQJ18438.1 WYL domain-containing protein [Nonlabens tegetincola]
MAVNKNALIRYKTIDKCLQNSMRNWTLQDLIAACSDALYEFEGRDINVSKRTIQLDIQMMRSEKLGYQAPIEVYDRKYYRYTDPNYSITKIPLSQNDMGILSETMDMLRQFKDFSLFQELSGLFNKLEDRIHTERHHKNAIIHLEQNTKLKGLELLDELYHAIQKQVVIEVFYQSFTAIAPSIITCHPYFLKEYNNRWFLIVKSNKSNKLITLALDRILGIDYDFSIEYSPSDINIEEYYKDTIGVTVLDNRNLKTIIFKVDSRNAPYVETKPFHSSQRFIEKDKNGWSTYSIKVHTNFELDRLLLGFGDSLEVLSPKRLRRRIAFKVQNAASRYNDILSN